MLHVVQSSSVVGGVPFYGGRNWDLAIWSYLLKIIQVREEPRLSCGPLDLQGHLLSLCRGSYRVYQGTEESQGRKWVRARTHVDVGLERELAFWWSKDKRLWVWQDVWIQGKQICPWKVLWRAGLHHPLFPKLVPKEGGRGWAGSPNGGTSSSEGWCVSGTFPSVLIKDLWQSLVGEIQKSCPQACPCGLPLNV